MCMISNLMVVHVDGIGVDWGRKRSATHLVTRAVQWVLIHRVALRCS